MKSSQSPSAKQRAAERKRWRRNDERAAKIIAAFLCDCGNEDCNFCAAQDFELQQARRVA